MASITKINGKWRALIRRKGHKPISKYCDTKAKATEWARGIEAQIDAGTAPRVLGDKTIAAHIVEYRGLRAKARPILDTSSEHYVLKQLSENLGHLVAARLSEDDLLGWATMRKDEGAGPYTVNTDLSRLGTVLRYTGGKLDAITAARPKLSYLGLIGGGGMRERRPTEEEMLDVLAWLEEHKGAVYAEFVWFAALTAMRRSEISRMLWSEVDEEKRMLLIRKRKHPRKKEGNDQTIPLLPDAWTALQRRPRDNDRVFPVHEQTMSKYFKEACDALGIPDLHLHDMRHEGTSRLFEDGFEIQEVALVSGHKDWRHLRRYTNLKPESLHARGSRQGT